MNRKEIRIQAKRIMDNFARALKKIKIEESRVERKEDRRKEEEGFEADENFRKIMFRNAPKKRNGCIEAERGEWVE